MYDSPEKTARHADRAVPENDTIFCHLPEGGELGLQGVINMRWRHRTGKPSRQSKALQCKHTNFIEQTITGSIIVVGTLTRKAFGKGPKIGVAWRPRNSERAGLTWSRPMLGLRRFQKRRGYNRPRVLNPRHSENNRPRSDRGSGRATSQSLGWCFASALAREACPQPTAR